MSFAKLPISRVADVELGKMLKTSPSDGDVLMPYLRAAHVQPGGRLIDLGDEQRMCFSPKEAATLTLKAGDMVVVEGGAGYGRSAVLERDYDGWAFQNSILRVRPRPGRADARFLSYALRTALDCGEIDLFVNTATIPHFTAEKVSRFVVPMPAAEEQGRIADYLDRETATIDALIEKQRALISGLRERRSAAVEHAVSGFTTSADETFVEGPSWMGSIPSTWRTFPLWAMYRREKRTGFIEEPMVSVFRDFGVVFKADRANLNETAEDRSIYQLVEPGWFVVNRMKAWQGSVGVSSIRGISSGHYLCFRPLHGENHKFLNWLFRSPQYRRGFAMLSRGVRPGQAEIDNDQLRKMPVVLPPLDEQREIADHLDRETAKIDALIAKAERFIELARERRAALITAAVTGQIEIPT